MKTLSLLLLTSCAARSFHPVAAPPDVPTDRPLQAGILVVNGVYQTELTAPYDIFQHTVFHTKPGIAVFTVSPDGGAIKTFEGMTIDPEYGFADAPPIDILVVPSAEHSMDTDLQDAALIEWVQRTGGSARFVMSLCDGAFVLAKAGLLEGHRVTTFPSDQDQFVATFPQLALVRGVSFVHDRKMFTSEGGRKSFDVALYLVEHLYGEEVARRVGRGLIIPWPPSDVPALVIRP